jgi:hypothetical protein
VITFKLGPVVTFNVYPESRFCETVFADGTSVSAVPEDNDAYRACARELGYGDDTWGMCFLHELFHSLLSYSQGRVVSPALWHVAHPKEVPDDDLIAREEDAVLTFQRQLNECRVNGRNIPNRP